MHNGRSAGLTSTLHLFISLHAPVGGLILRERRLLTAEPMRKQNFRTFLAGFGLLATH